MISGFEGKGIYGLCDGRLARDLDFSKAETRSWYWQHLEPTFDTGMVGWWNDEADNSNNFQFLNMGRALYEGQRGHSNLREWSINRNNYLGAQRYGYAEWSGDIPTGFAAMRISACACSRRSTQASRIGAWIQEILRPPYTGELCALDGVRRVRAD